MLTRNGARVVEESELALICLLQTPNWQSQLLDLDIGASLVQSIQGHYCSRSTLMLFHGYGICKTTIMGTRAAQTLHKRAFAALYYLALPQIFTYGHYRTRWYGNPVMLHYISRGYSITFTRHAASSRS
jgi:hypothetical protein